MFTLVFFNSLYNGGVVSVASVSKHHVAKVYKGREGTVSHILDLGTRWT
jgi:hypothetical protein